MPSEDLGPYNEKFHTEIENSLEPKLKQIGLILINVNIEDVVKTDTKKLEI